MTDLELKRTIEATQEVIRNRNRNGSKARSRYTPVLRSAIVTAAKTMGVGRFAEATGIDTNLIYQWVGMLKGEFKPRDTQEKRRRVISPEGRNRLSQPAGGVNAVRQIEIIPEGFPFASPNHPNGIAIVRAGDQLAIQIPLSSSSAEWVAQIANSLNRLNGGNHV